MNSNLKSYLYKALAILLTVLIFFALLFIPSYKNSQIGGVHQKNFLANIWNYKDKGFNESSYNGALNYAKNSNEKVGLYQADYSEDPNGYVPELKDIFSFDDAEMVLNVGFNTVESSKTILNNPKYEDKWIAVLDDNTISTESHGIGIDFKSDEGGFIAGIAASVYATYNYIVNPNIDHSIVGIWGGIPIPPVYNYLSGFEQGVNWFNYAVLGYGVTEDENYEFNPEFDSLNLKAQSDLWNQKSPEKVLINDGQDVNKASTNISYDSNKKISSNDWYTFSFEPDDTQAVDKSKRFTDSKNEYAASSIFAVAGGQTKAAIAQASLNRGNLHSTVLGVDNNLNLITNNANQEYILGSSIKNVDLAAQLAFWVQPVLAQNEQNLDKQDLKPSLNINDSFYYSNEDDPIIDNQTYQNYGNIFLDPIEDGGSGWYNKTYSTQEGFDGYQFTGDYNNKGIGFAYDESTSLLDDAFNYLFAPQIIENPTFNILDLFDIGFSQNTDQSSGTILIELSSNSFTDDVANPNDHLSTLLAAPWIPNWNIYK